MGARKEEEIEMGTEEEIDEGFECHEIDFDYEFDAPQFFDFTRPEAEIEYIQAERWFEPAAGYPPSPLIVKLRSVKHMPTKKMESSKRHKDRVRLRAMNAAADYKLSTKSEVSNPGLKVRLDPAQSGCRGSTLMKPTASHLAKQRKPSETNERFLRSCFEQNSALDTQATKRQKLNSGLKRKGFYVKQKITFLHKAHKKVHVSYVNQLRVTIPRGPYLKTALRAQRRMCNTDEQAGYIFKARPLNRKILQAPSLSFREKSIPQLPKFHEFFFKTSERAMQHKCSNTRNISDLISQQRSKAKDGSRSNFSESLKHESGNTVNKLKGNPLRKVKPCNSLQEIQIMRYRKFLTNLPAEPFSKDNFQLALVPEIQQVA